MKEITIIASLCGGMIFGVSVAQMTPFYNNVVGIISAVIFGAIGLAAALISQKKRIKKENN